MTISQVILRFSGWQDDGTFALPSDTRRLVDAAILSGQIKEDKDNLGYYDVTGIGYPGGQRPGEALFNPFGL